MLTLKDIINSLKFEKAIGYSSDQNQRYSHLDVLHINELNPITIDYNKNFRKTSLNYFLSKKYNGGNHLTEFYFGYEMNYWNKYGHILSRCSKCNLNIIYHIYYKTYVVANSNFTGFYPNMTIPTCEEMIMQKALE